MARLRTATATSSLGNSQEQMLPIRVVAKPGFTLAFFYSITILELCTNYSKSLNGVNQEMYIRFIFSLIGLEVCRKTKKDTMANSTNYQRRISKVSFKYKPKPILQIFGILKTCFSFADLRRLRAT